MSRQESLLRFWLGRQVAVVIDRPLGSRHPRHPDLAYPVNYGYVPNTEAGDREALDAYVLGVTVAISSFIGEVIAIIMRIDDIEDKLIVAPAGERISREEIADAVRFQEQYFDTEILVSPSYPGELEDDS